MMKEKGIRLSLSIHRLKKVKVTPMHFKLHRIAKGESKKEIINSNEQNLTLLANSRVLSFPLYRGEIIGRYSTWSDNKV